MIYDIGIDLDGVCRNFPEAMNRTFAEVYPNLAKEIKPQVDYNFDAWPFKKAGIDPWDFMKKYPQEIFALADKIPGAIEAITEIVNTLEPKGHRILICSHQLPEISRYSWLWLYLNQVPVSNVIFVPESKEKWKYVDIMIDDSPHVMEAKPKDKISFKVNLPYNKDSKSNHSIDHVSEFLPIFMKEYQK